MASGVDSVTPANSSYGGTDLAAYVESYNMQHTGTTSVFWGRYFAGLPDKKFIPMNYEGTTNIQQECDKMKAQGIRWIVPINSPQGVASNGASVRIAGTYSDGYADGQAACKAVSDTITASGGRLQLPGNDYLDIYLDVEPHFPFSQDYWNGWSDAVNNNAGPNNSYPFYSACYCDPADGQPCVVSDNATNWPFDVIWANEPSTMCGGCSISPA